MCGTVPLGACFVFLFQSLVKRLETRYVVEPVMKNEFHSVMKNYRM